MIHGSQYLVWYFQCLGATIGKNVCLYPNGGDPMMTEPDLVTIGIYIYIYMYIYIHIFICVIFNR
jgi:hypothetical protein